MSKEITYVIGHKNPDTDSICSAIALAELKQAEGAVNVVAARAGDVNPQTAFILDYFKVQPPKFVADVYPRAKDIMSTGIVKINSDTPLIQIMELMREEGIRFIPVLDGGDKPKGVLTLMELAKRYIEAETTIEVETTVPNIIKTLGATALLNQHGSEVIKLSAYIGAMSEESFLKTISDKDPKVCAVIVGDRLDIQKTSIDRGVGLIIITGGFSLSDELLKTAGKKGTSIIVSPHDSATTAIMVRLSTPAGLLCDGNFDKVSPDDLVEEIKHKAATVPGLLVIDDEGVMLGVITKTNVITPSATNLILVDHNEMAQAVDGAERVNIIEVVDHHRIGNFHSVNPMPFLCDPVGATSTLVAELYKRKNIPIRKEVAGLLLGGVLTDTVILKSPTTTHRDKEIIKWLEEKSGLDHKAFGTEIFAASSSLKARGPVAVVNADYKLFEAKGKKFGVGQVETVGFDELFEEKNKLMELLLKVKDEKGLQMSGLLVTDIAVGNSLLLVAADKEVLYNLNYPKVEENVFDLKGVLSRKKQVVPHLLNVFNQVY